MQQQQPRAIMSAEEMAWALTRMTHQILEQNHGADNVLLLGVLTRGLPLARRIAGIAQSQGHHFEVGQLDITMYRDDLRANPTRPVGRTIVPSTVDGRYVVLVDDVLYSGRTVQAALHALADLGRPAAVQLAVLADRGGRELPIQADVVGKSVPAARDERVRVLLAETDGVDAVTIERSAS